MGNGDSGIEPTIESGAGSRTRPRLPVRTVVLLAVSTALLMPVVGHAVAPSVVALAVTAGESQPPVEAPPSRAVDEPTTTAALVPVSIPPATTTAPLQVSAGPASTTTTAAKAVASPTTTSPKSSATSATLPLLPLPVPLPPVSVPPPSPSVTLFPLPTPASQPMGIVSGPDGNLWFTEGNRDVVGRITPQGTITEFPTPTKGSQPTVITVGPDRNLWFTEIAGNKVARMTPSGAVTEYALPTAYGFPLHGITTGPDGALWFTLHNAGKIGRVDLGGQVTEFAAGTDTPGQIVAGRDGNLWYTGSGGGASLWRMSPGGSTSAVAVGDLTAVSALTVDRAGNLWYAGSNPDTGRVGRRDAAGRVTEFAIPGRYLSFTGMVEGPDGAMWLSHGNTILRLAHDGTLTSFSAPSPMRITSGPDGNIWFTSGTNGNAIGRIRVA